MLGRWSQNRALWSSLIVRRKIGRMEHTILRRILISPKNSRAERGQIQDNHYRGEQIHAHGNTDADMHEQNGDQPRTPHLAMPNEKSVAEFQRENCDPSHRERISKSDENICRNKIEWWARESAPKVDPVPPISAKCFG